MMPVAYNKGKEDFRRNVKCEDCPYDIDTKECEQWVVGWQDACEEDTGGRP